jgi:hypothetical protein
LGEANKYDFGYTELIENIKDFNINDVSTYQIFCLRQKCSYLALAPTLAKENMNKWTWKKCCEEAIMLLKKTGIKQTSNPQSIVDWYGKFRVKMRFTLVIQRNRLPPLLEQNQDITTINQTVLQRTLGRVIC